jgi:hypothetical protein
MAAIHVSESIFGRRPAKPICTNCGAGFPVISPFAEIGY